MVTKGNTQKFVFLGFFRPTQKLPGRAPNGAGKFFFRLIQTLPTLWATRISCLRIFILGICWIPIFQIFRSPKNVFTGGCRLPDPLLFLGGFQPPRPPGGGPAAPRAPLHTKRLRLSGSPFSFWYQDPDTKILARHGTEIFGTARIIRARHGNIWHGTDPPDPGTARHRTSLRLGHQASQHLPARGKMQKITPNEAASFFLPQLIKTQPAF